MARLAQLYEQVQKGRDVRANLISIRENIADEALRRSFLTLLDGDTSTLCGLLRDADPKVRRNAALILGRVAGEDVLPDLLEAWAAEETLFVREDYLKAIAGMDYAAHLSVLEKRIAQLEEQLAHADGEAAAAALPSDAEQAEASALWDNNKHLLAELSRLREMVGRCTGEKRHTFLRARLHPAPDIMLLTNRLHADVTAQQVQTGAVRAMRGAVYVKGGDLEEIGAIRTWTELLFLIPGARPVHGDERDIAQQLRGLKIGNYLKYLHEDNGQPFRYRIEVKSRTLPRGKRGEWIRRIAQRLDALERGGLQNTDSDYEAELRLIERSDGSWQPLLKLFTLPDMRFSYRREVTAQSTAGPLSALAMALARPYLKEGAQVLDPFCGSGTLLIERSLALAADPLYGVDRFGEAVEKARENTVRLQRENGKNLYGEGAAPQFFFINRDFFDFTHDYRFDEVVTELPRLPGEESGAFAAHFLEKVRTLLKEKAVLAVLTDAPQALRQAAAQQAVYGVRAEHLLNERTGTSLLVLEGR